MEAAETIPQSCPSRLTPEYRAALAFLFDRIDYERSVRMPYSQRDLNLSRMRRLLDLLGNPHLKVDVIHVAGTKGKGSVASFLSSALAHAGLKCGSYTSPHLHFVEERFRINNTPCFPEQLVSLIDGVRPAVLQMDEEGTGGPTYFEIATAIAFQFFLQQGVDIAVLEVGLGGRLDSTNVCEPLVSVITSISFDHTKQLGNTLREIATEKAGIIKPGVPIVTGATNEEARTAIRQIASQRQAGLLEIDVDFGYSSYQAPDGATSLATADMQRIAKAPRSTLKSVQLGLIGEHQAANACVAVAALDLLPAALRPSDEAVCTGFESARCEGRIEVVPQTPTVIIDTAHNIASVRALVDVLNTSFTQRRRHLLLGVTRGKDVEGMLRVLLPEFENVVCTRYQNNPRGLAAHTLQATAQTVSDQLAPQTTNRIVSSESPLDAWDTIRRMSMPDDLICATGSFFIAAEIRDLLARQRMCCDHGSAQSMGPA